MSPSNLSLLELPDLRVEVDIANQRLVLCKGESPLRSYAISTAKNGAGCQRNSFCTPVGLHRVRLKIGDGEPVGAVFVGRRPTGEVFSKTLAKEFPGRDWILTRILWLQGLEPGVNRGGAVDTLRRYIYIHGTAEESDIGVPCSDGCIRMRNRDITELFRIVEVGTKVLIV